LGQLKIWLALILLWVIFGTIYLAFKIAIDTIPPLLTAAIRCLVAGLILFLIYYLNSDRKNEPLLDKEKWRDAIVIGAAVMFAAQGLWVWAEQFLSSGITALLNSTIPLWVIVFRRLAYKQHISPVMMLGIVVGFGGLTFLVAPSLRTGTLDLFGTIAVLSSSIFFVMGTLYSRKANLPNSVSGSTGMIMLSGGVLLLIMSFAIGELDTFELSQISVHSAAALLYLIVVCSIILYTDFFWVIRITSASLANTFAYVSPVIAVILGWALLEEQINLNTIIAMGIILGGVALIVTTSKKISKESTHLR
jgi:drug/metabolite transporter (DMT)-like permease